MTYESVTPEVEGVPSGPAEPSSAAADPVSYRRIALVALPMMFSTVAGIGEQLVIMALIGRMGEDALYVRSVYNPVSYLFLALTTGFAVTLQVRVAQASGRGERERTGAYLGGIGRATIAVFGVVGVLLVLGSGPLSTLVGVVPDQQGTFRGFLAAMTVASVVSTLGELCSAALRGSGRALTAAFITSMHVIVTVGLVLAGLGLDAGLPAVPVAVAAAGVLEVTLGLIFLGRGGMVLRTLAARAAGTWALLGRIGAPVSASSVLLAVVNLILLRIVEPAGELAVSGFAVGYAVQAAIIVPAVGFGSAVAVLMNQALPREGLSVARRALRRGLIAACAGYGAATVALALWGGGLVAFLAGDPEVAEQARHMVLVVGPTFGCTGLSLVLLTILEHVGYGALAVALNATYFAAMLAIGGWLTYHSHDVGSLYATMAVAAVAGVALSLPITIAAARHPRLLQH
jgi:Na+-driven multidrug efflux pump